VRRKNNLILARQSARGFTRNHARYSFSGADHPVSWGKRRMPHRRPAGGSRRTPDWRAAVLCGYRPIATVLGFDPNMGQPYSAHRLARAETGEYPYYIATRWASISTICWAHLDATPSCDIVLLHGCLHNHSNGGRPIARGMDADGAFMNERGPRSFLFRYSPYLGLGRG